MLPILPLLLEVMDKEPGALALWASALVWGGLGFFAGRWRWWAATPFIVWGVLSGLAVATELRDPFVGPAMRAEAGPLYVWHAGLSTVIFVALPTIGALVGRRRSRSARSAAA